MGLDMYLFKKSKLADTSKGATGACGGLFPIAPATYGKMEEIGYWRKAYSVCDYILMLLDTPYLDVNCKNLRVKKAYCEEILQKAKRKLEEEDFQDDWEKENWKDTITIFKRALEAIEKEKAQIYFHIWY